MLPAAVRNSWSYFLAIFLAILECARLSWQSSAVVQHERVFAMTNESKSESAEQRLIARYFKPLATHPGAFGLSDDAAAIPPPAGCELLLTTAGVIGAAHFFPDHPPHT